MVSCIMLKIVDMIVICLLGKEEMTVRNGGITTVTYKQALHGVSEGVLHGVHYPVC